MTKFDPTLPVQTRDGKKVQILSTEGDSLIAYVEKGQSHPCSGGVWALRVYNVNGKYFGSTGADSCVDLINCPPTKVKKEGWVNIYKRYSNPLELGVRTGGVFKSEELAKEAAYVAHHARNPLPIATVKIEWEEEQ